VNLPAQQFRRDAERMTKDLRHRSLIQTALNKYEVARDARKARFQDWQSARQTAAEIKWDAINHLDKYLTELVDKLEARGTKAHWATTGEQARQIILGIVREKKARSVINQR
jgi:L-lactate dehydrogenase complex protein LldF